MSISAVAKWCGAPSLFSQPPESASLMLNVCLMSDSAKDESCLSSKALMEEIEVLQSWNQAASANDDNQWISPINRNVRITDYVTELLDRK